MNEWIVQGIGFVGVLFFLLSYQVKTNRGLFLCQSLGCGMFGLMGALSGCASLIVNMLRNVLLLKYKDWAWVRSKVTLGAVIAALAVILYCTWAGPVSLLPFIGVTVSSIGYWTNNPQQIRLSQIACNSPASLLYDILIGSWGGVLSESMTIISILVSIYRFGWKNMESSDGSIAEK